jgi:hypothetical protein
VTARSDKPKAAHDLRSWLDKLGMTVQAFAILVETRTGTVSCWLRGVRRPMAKRAETIERLTNGAVRRGEWGTDKQRSWTAEHDALLPRLHALGWDDRRIGEYLDRSPSSVRTRRSHFGITRKPWRAAAVTEAPSFALINELRSRGFAVTEAPTHGGVVSF